MKIKCPSCGHEVDPVEDPTKGIYSCPECEEEMPGAPEAVLRFEEEEEDILPGLKPGERLGAYEVIDFMSSGGMAVMLIGKQLSLNRIVAIKVLPKRFTLNRLLVSRFESEASALAELNHPNIVSVIDRGREKDIYFIVMEYIEGEDLRRRLARQGLLAQEEAIEIIRQILSALQYAHGRGIVHRDVKPGNVMIAKTGGVKVTDFGLAQLTSEKAINAFTMTGQTMGTLKYMAPEQLVDSKRADARSDLYSTGVVLYELLTGHMPVGAFRLPSDLVPEVDPRLDEVILRALRTEPDDRYSSAKEFADALEHIAKTPRTPTAEAPEFVATQVSAEAQKLVACAKCGFVSRSNAHACEKCRTSLEHLFENCPACAASVRADIPTCPNCGDSLRTWRAEMRREVTDRQTKVKTLVANQEFDGAFTELQKLTELKGPLYEAVRNSAKSWLTRVEQRMKVRRQQTYDAARRLLVESSCEKAIELLERLPSDYAETGALIARARERIQTGMAYRTRAQAADEAGDRETALAYYRKAGEVWPHDQKLHKIRTDILQSIANKKMVQKYLEEARAAAAKEDFIDAIALCRRASELDPSDANVMELLLQLEAQEAEAQAEIPSQYMTPQGLVIPKTHPNRKPFFIVVGAILLAAAFLALILVTQNQRTVSRVNRMMANAADLEGRGDFDQAIAVYTSVARDYGNTPAGAVAKQKVKVLREIENTCKALSVNAGVLAKNGQLIEAGETYKKIVLDIENRRFLGAVTEARGQMRLLADPLTKAGAKEEAAKHLRKALSYYNEAASMLEVEPPSIGRVQGGIARAGDLIAQAGKQMQAGEFDAAAGALAQAEKIMPGNRLLPGIVRQILPKLPAPPGMVYVPDGEFYYGADDGDDDEKPRRKETLEYGCYIDVNEVTNADYQEFLAANPNLGSPPFWAGRKPPAGGEKLPLVNVLAIEADRYAGWSHKRLPTEKEWERTARGIFGTKYPWGNDWSQAKGIFQMAPAPVGSCPDDISPEPSPCKDMAGNVAEWTSSVWEKDPTARVVRGGSWAGPEPDRWIKPVFGELVPPATKGVEFALIDSPQTPVVSVMYRQDMYVTLVGTSGSEDRADIAVAKWLPDFKQWVSTRFVVDTQGEEIGTRKSVALNPRNPRSRGVTVDFSTGCVFEGFKPGAPVLTILYTDNLGARREMAKSGPPTLSPPPAALKPWTPPPAKKKPAHTLADVTRCANRMKAPTNTRYINVGLRCAKTPDLVAPLLGVAPEPDEAPPAAVSPEVPRKEASVN